jgi:hypothetical protein
MNDWKDAARLNVFVAFMCERLFQHTHKGHWGECEYGYLAGASGTDSERGGRRGKFCIHGCGRGDAPSTVISILTGARDEA